MNSFFFRVANKIQWRSRNSDDIITVVDEAQKGHAGFRFTPVMNKFDVWISKRKSNTGGGSISMYDSEGSYKLIIYSVMFHPDCISIRQSESGYDNLIRTNNAYPKIMSGRIRKAENKMENKKMNIVYKKVKDLIPYENNPRNNDEAVDYVAKSIEEFGFKVPCVVSGDGVLITGHTRLKACKKLGIDEVPCIVADDLTEDQVKAFRIADNKVSEYSTWDNEKLAEELSEIMMDMGQFGEDLFKDDDTMDVDLGEEDNPYSQKKHVPQYEPTGDFVDIMDLIDDEKTNELIKEIKESNVTEDQKNFLIKSAYRHMKFNYSKIADYYSNASEEMQILMEKSALVIIDIDDAIANGYVKLTKVVEDLIAEDDGGEDDGE